MKKIKTSHGRRSFLKTSVLAGGGLAIGFSIFAGCKTEPKEAKVLDLPPLEPGIDLPKEWFDINTYIQIGENGVVTIQSANPEIGQNIKTSMPMIVAEELDIDWKNVVVEQAPLNDNFTRQVAGGSQSIRKSWEGLRMAGATVKAMLLMAAAQQWNCEVTDLTAANGVITKNTGETLGYGKVASLAGTMTAPEEVQLKDPKDFKIIGQGKGNVDMMDIIQGKPLFGIDTKKAGMKYASVLRPPAFGMELVSVDDAAARAVNGVSDVIQFGNKVAILAKNNWAAMKGKKALKAEWKQASKAESTSDHDADMLALLDKTAEKPERADGDIKAAFAAADKVLERTYEVPFLPHNCLEPMNFYADVTDEKAELVGPIQTPAWTRSRVATLLNREEKDVTIDMTRMGGGFGRRLYGDFALEAAEISQKAKTPVQVLFTREDDMTAGMYRPPAKYKFRASLKDGAITGYHLTGVTANVREGSDWDKCVRPKTFPAGAIKNTLYEAHWIESNITTGAWRAPITNSLAYAEQAFLDEVAAELDKDPIAFRIELFEAAKANPVGEFEYDADKSIGVMKLAAEKANWGKAAEGVSQGFSTYYSHNSYVAEIAEVVTKNGKPVVNKIVAAVDCGIVVNPKGAQNQAEGGVIDGVGHAMYGAFTFQDGKPQAANFDEYQLIRMPQVPEVEVHFVESLNDPTGLGEPTLPPAGGAVANAMHKATGKRFYKQPFVGYEEVLG